MLDDREQKSLQELEDQLVKEDPRLAQALRGQAASPLRRRDHQGGVRIATTMAWLFASLLLAAGYVAAALSVLSLAVMLWALWRYSDRWQVTPCFPPKDRGEHR